MNMSLIKWKLTRINGETFTGGGSDAADIFTSFLGFS